MQGPGLDSFPNHFSLTSFGFRVQGLGFKLEPGWGALGVGTHELHCRSLNKIVTIRLDGLCKNDCRFLVGGFGFQDQI